MSEKRIGVIGAGTMGIGIAQAFTQKGFDVTLIDKEERILEDAKKYIFKGLEKLVELGKITRYEKDEYKKKIKTSLDINDLINSRIIVEAVNENLKLKLDLFKKLDSLTSKNIILATNTSTLSITKIAKATNNPERVIGIHFFIPAEIMKLVEVIPGDKTSRDVIKRSIDLLKDIKKIPIKCKDSPGFIVNRLHLLFQNEAVKLLDDKIAAIEDIDDAIKLGLNYKMGPFELADFIGLDVLYNSLTILNEEIGGGRYKPAKTLKYLVEAGKLGRKTKQGFYKY